MQKIVGNPAAVEDAKDIINSAVIGLVLALSSWLILNEINPDVLVISRKPGITGQTWPGYTYNQLNRACVAGPNLEGVPIPDSQDRKCKCVDGKEVTFTPSAPPTGPYVVSTSIVPCAKGVPTSPAEITITFGSPVAAIDASSVTNPPPIGAMSFRGPGPAISSVTMTSANVAKVTFAGNFLANQDYELIVGASVRDTAGNTLGSAYHVRFTTAGSFSGTSCVQPVPTIVNCQVACSNPSTPDLNPSGYHCMKADLRVGATAHPFSDSVTINKGDSLYFDARSGSASYAYPGLNLKGDPYDPDSNFNNGVDRYEINCVETNPSGLCGTFSSVGYGCSESTTCSTLGGGISWAVRGLSFWGVCGIEVITKDDAWGYPFNNPGTYKIHLRVYAKNSCSTAEKDVIVNVNP